jgi:integrase
VRRVERGDLTDAEKCDHWERLYLRINEIDELLQFFRASSAQPWIYPLVCTAAHTGARRSELLRIGIEDVDFVGGIVMIREKKRTRGTRTTRHVTMSPFLQKVLSEWLTVHPGGHSLFCQTVTVVRSKTKRSAPTPITRDEAHDHFKRTIAGSKWQVLRGYHVLRHSFISCLAAKGIDQRIIDEFTGHQTEEQRRRYRHLTPDVKQQAIQTVFA